MYEILLNNLMILKIYRLHPNSKIPTRGTKESSGLDLYACINDKIIIKPGEKKKIPNGISISLPEYHEGQIRSRSGLAFKYGIIVLTTGTIDADFRGEITTLLYNISKKDFIIEPNMRVSQIIISKFEKCDIEEVNSINKLDDDLKQNQRKENGYGSTGLF